MRQSQIKLTEAYFHAEYETANERRKQQVVLGADFAKPGREEEMSGLGRGRLAPEKRRGLDKMRGRGSLPQCSKSLWETFGSAGGLDEFDNSGIGPHA
jgi:hypothetical protein